MKNLLKPSLTLFIILITSNAFAFDQIVYDSFDTAGPSNLLNDSEPDTGPSGELWVAESNLSKGGTSNNNGYVFLDESTVPDDGQTGYIKLSDNTDGSFFENGYSYTINADVALYPQDNEFGHITISFRNSVSDLSTNNLPILWVSAYADVGIVLGNNGVQAALKDFISDYDPTSYVELATFSIVISCLEDNWKVEALYNGEKIKNSDGDYLELALTDTAKQSMLEANPVYLALNTSVISTLSDKGLNSGFDSIEAVKNSIPETGAIAIYVGLFLGIFVAFRKNRINR